MVGCSESVVSRAFMGDSGLLNLELTFILLSVCFQKNVGWGGKVKREDEAVILSR
jgi:hypothetical protein